MSQFIIPSILFVATFAIMFAAISCWGYFVRKRNRRSPLTRNLLRSPGETLRSQLEKIDQETDYFLIVSIFTPLLMYGIHISTSYFSAKPETISRILASGAAGICVLGFSMWKVLTLSDSGRRKRLGMEGELYTGSELNQLLLSGCRVFHDVPTDYGNIDHVVVSKSGVFVVETKMIGKLREGGSAKITIDYPRKCVKFSDRDWRLPTEQLDTNAAWLSNFLKSSVGRPVKVEPMLALPGYFIEKRIGRGAVVFNPKNPETFFVQKHEIHSSNDIQQIAFQIEQLCRNIKPSFLYKKTWQ